MRGRSWSRRPDASSGASPSHPINTIVCLLLFFPFARLELGQLMEDVAKKGPNQRQKRKVRQTKTNQDNQQQKKKQKNKKKTLGLAQSEGAMTRRVKSRPSRFTTLRNSSDSKCSTALRVLACVLRCPCHRYLRRNRRLPRGLANSTCPSRSFCRP